MNADAVVREFWNLMATNDVHAVKRVPEPYPAPAHLVHLVETAQQDGSDA